MKFILGILLISLHLFSYSQATDRYNFIQKQTDSSVMVAWRTNTSAIGTIQWGLDSLNLDNTLSDPSATDKHAFDLFGLQSNTKYYYQTSTDAGFLSDVDHFYTAKTAQNSNFTFLHYGDCGYNNTVQNTIADLMHDEYADFGIVAGDVDQAIGNNYDGVYFNVYKDILKNYCHFTAIGNHDTYYDDAATYLDAFYLPTNNPQGSERYYSFVWGNAKFICMDSNIPYTPGTDQFNWLVDEMQCNNHQWLFIFFHHPPWTNAWSADYYLPFSEYFLYQGNEDMRTDLVPLFEQYDVDFILNGHSHCYQRGEMNGVKYVISGGAGSAAIDFNTNSNSPNIDTEIYTNQYVRFNVNGDSVWYVSIDAAGTVIDSVYSEKTGWTPFSASISESNNILYASSGTAYQWYLDGLEIPGATFDYYEALVDGLYQVEIMNEHGCSFLSEEYLIDDAEIMEWDQQFSIAPNPFTDQITVKNESGMGADMSLVDIYGKRLGEFKSISSESLNIDLSHLSIGTYFLQIRTASYEFVEKILKTN